MSGRGAWGHTPGDDDPRLLAFVLQHERRRMLAMGALLAIVGVLEGLGVAALLPVLDTVLSVDSAQRSGLAEAVETALRSVGIPPSLGVLLSGLVAVFVVKALVSYFAALRVAGMASRVAMELRQRLLRAVTRARWIHVLGYPSGFVVNALSSEADKTGAAVHTLAQVMADGLLVVAYVAVAVAISWPTALAGVITAAAILGGLRGRVMSTREAAQDQVEILRSVIARITDALPGLKPLKAMASEDYLLPRLEAQNRAYYEAQYRGIAATELIAKAREPLLIAVLALGLWLLSGLLSLASTSALVLALLFYRTVTRITHIQQRWATVLAGESAFRSLMDHIVAAERWAEHGADAASTSRASSPASMKREGADGADPHGPRTAADVRLDRQLRLDGVSFAYGDRIVLHSVDFVLPARALVVVTGSSGAGKTTLVDLVAGLLQPSGGRILVDGVDLAVLDVRRWRRTIGYVPQEPTLFADTVRGNIALGAALRDEEIRRALEIADAASFVLDLEGGLEHRLGEGGAGLSGGERQRLAIARAVARRPSLLILDEPTASLDQAVATDVRSAIARLRGALSILVVSHDSAFTALADRVWRL